MLGAWTTALVLAVAAPFVPNDPGYEANRASLEAMSVPQAWSVTQGDPAVVIAVLDTGVAQVRDLDLTPGFNAIDGSADTSDENGHGTAMAAISGAAIDNSIGIAGVCGKCRIMPIKTDAAHLGTAVDWAVAHGASLIDVSCAAGGLGPAIKNAVSHGVPVFVCAGADADPAAVRVGPFAQGSPSDASVDVAAESSFTTFGTWPSPGGASSATAAVAGIAALMVSCNPVVTPAEIKRILHTPGEVNAYEAVERAGCRATPPAIVRLMVRTRGRGTVTRRPDDDTYNAGTVIVLRAKPKPNWRFARWDGVCHGRRATCTVRLMQSGVTTAVFRRKSGV
jgi:hypothetical protein